MAKWTVGDLMDELKGYDETSPVVIYSFKDKWEYEFAIDDDTDQIRLVIL